MSFEARQIVDLVTPGVAARISGLELLNSMLAGHLPAPPFSETTGIWPTTFEPGYAVFEGTPSASFYNPMGTVHGGWIAALLDSAMASAVHTTLEPGQTCSTIEMKTVFVRAVTAKSGLLRCEGKLLHAGKRVAHAEGKLFDDSGKLIAYGSETCQIASLHDQRSPDNHTQSTQQGDVK